MSLSDVLFGTRWGLRSIQPQIQKPDYILTPAQVNRLYRILGLPEIAKTGEPIMDHVDHLLDWLEARMGPPNANGGGG